MSFTHVLPQRYPRGAPPIEYRIMDRLEEIIARIEDGSPDDLFGMRELAGEMECDEAWLRAIVRIANRGPEPTPVGKRLVFRRRAVLAWLKFLRKNRAKLTPSQE